MQRIVYVSWPATEVSGGIKAAFGHVGMLNEAGFDAVVATQDAVMPGWFETRAQVITLGQVRAGDVLVFPENNPQLLAAFAGTAHAKLVFCQNPFYAHKGLAGALSFADLGVRAIMCPSLSALHYCRRRFPGMALAYTPFHVDHERFAFRADKLLQIAAVPRKRPTEFGAIADLFRAGYPQYRSVPWVYLQQATEAQVAETMGRSAVFLSLARLEAHGMTALEAMACGCVVAGFTGLAGGSDSSTVRNGFWAAEDDIPGCVDQLARAVQLAMDGGPVLDEMVAHARRTAAEYRREESARRLAGFWRDTLAQLAA